ncbi:MAG: hypothetical protein PVJ04_08465 [Gemmatimonadota bacterium]|jgi:hypothetical protein
MDVKRFLTGTIVGGVVLFVLGWLIWMVLFAGFFEGQTGTAMGVPKDPPVMWAQILGTLSLAALYTLIIQWRGDSTVMDGLKTGAIAGFLLWFGVDIILFSVWNVSTLTGTISDSILELVRTAITGAVIVAVAGKKGAET